MARNLRRWLRREEEAEAEGELWVGHTEALLGVQDVFIRCCLVLSCDCEMYIDRGPTVSGALRGND